MNTRSDPQNELSRVLQKICEIAEKFADGDYIFRGESRSYGKVVSSLYRQYEYDIEADDFEIEFVQKEILDEAREYTEKTDEFEILIELLHHGGKTNLIDFTTDLHIALFFACDGAPSEDGRVILQKRDSVAGYLEQPRKPKNRIISQKSIFVRPPKGFINPDEIITIPADLKLPMLEYLRKSHGISTETIYNDFHGFMTNRSIHEGAYTQFHKGRASQKRGDAAQNWNEKLTWYERAVVHYTEALELKPDFPEGYNNRGTVYADAGDFDRAIKDHNAAIELKPDYVSAYNNRGIAYYRIGDFDRAILDYSKAIELKPDYVSAYNNLGITYSKRGEYERAIQYYNTVIELRHDFTEGYNNRGLAYHKKAEIDNAIKDFNRVIELAPYYTEGYSQSRRAFAIKDEFDKAIADFKMVLALKNDYAEVYYNLGVTYEKKGEYDKAIENHNTAIELKPDFADAYYALGIVYREMGDRDQEFQNYTTAIKLKPDFAMAFNNRGNIYAFKDNHDKAIEDYTTAITLDQNHANVYFNRGISYGAKRTIQGDTRL